MERPSWAPTEIDLDRPSAARIYDYVLGGSHNFAVDRQFAKQLLTLFPEAPDEAHANRAFLRRAVAYCVEAGVRQFIDIGSGIPTEGNVHQVAQKLAPDSRVLYVDMDPVAVTHSRAILDGNDRAAVLQADVRDPDSVLEDPATRELIDFSEPVAVSMIALLHFVSDDQNPQGIVRRFAEVAAPGSFLAITHGTGDHNPERIKRLTEMYANTPNPTTFRSKDQVAALFEGWTLVEPGLVSPNVWHPDSPEDADPEGDAVDLYVGVGRKDGDRHL